MPLTGKKDVYSVLMDVKKILEELPDKAQGRGRVTVFISKSLWTKFQKAVKGRDKKVPDVLEALMEGAIAELEKKK